MHRIPLKTQESEPILFFVIEDLGYNVDKKKLWINSNKD
jgi:hypothetical protein